MPMKKALYVMPLAISVASVAAVPAAQAREPQGVYQLGVTPASAPPEEPPAARATLTCGPDGGTPARASAACDQLERADGDIAKIPADPGPCTKEFAPVKVSADGMWNGRVRRFVQTYPNRCTAIRETGGVLFSLPTPARKSPARP
ncbi:SSI family serine proteinase inhibitor [Actinomadura sediminis]|uniref:SSI family serine proteinase inhibitor n=1 Tax=Actinomadura sediminis TaxID=1038904 RepID=A0ABW3EJZ3_9ACTN